MRQSNKPAIQNDNSKTHEGRFLHKAVVEKTNLLDGPALQKPAT